MRTHDSVAFCGELAFALVKIGILTYREFVRTLSSVRPVHECRMITAEKLFMAKENFIHTEKNRHAFIRCVIMIAAPTLGRRIIPSVRAGMESHFVEERGRSSLGGLSTIDGGRRGLLFRLGGGRWTLFRPGRAPQLVLLRRVLKFAWFPSFNTAPAQAPRLWRGGDFCFCYCFCATSAVLFSPAVPGFVVS